MTVSHAPRQIGREDLNEDINWHVFVDAIDAGHALPRAQVDDVFVGPPGQTLLSRAAWIDGLGFGVKSVTVFPDNTPKGIPSIQGGMMVFDGDTGNLVATIDAGLITDLKTAADSVLGATYLARPDSKTLLILGAGPVASTVAQAYHQVFPTLEQIRIWNRTPTKAVALAERLCARGLPVTVADDLPGTCANADIITTATMSKDPVLQGNWVRPGCHVDLIGAFREDMREADDALLCKSRLFVDSRDTTIHQIGELKIPLSAGVITEADILGDLYDLRSGFEGRADAQDITVFKNGGGAHLDLMIACAVLKILSVESVQTS